VITHTDEGRVRTLRTPAERRADLQRRIAHLDPDERALLDACLTGAAQDADLGLGPILHQHRFAREPVDMATFIDDPYYLGESCGTLYPVLRKELINIFEVSARYREVILGGSTGYGKTTVLSIVMCRLLYELSCLINPQAAYGLSPGSEMSVVIMSKNLPVTRKVLKSAIDAKIQLSPYFHEHFPFHIGPDETKFPHNVQLSIASYYAERTIGSNVVSASLDEMNFVQAKRQQISTADGAAKSLAHFDRAEMAYQSLSRRIKSRFMTAGGDLPGMIVMISSANTVGSFIDRRVIAAQTDSSVYVFEAATWECKPPGSFSGQRFGVLCGGSSLRSRILGPDETLTPDQIPDGARVIRVPEEYRAEFEGDLENAIRDIAGVATTAISAFIQRPERIAACVDPRRRHPASVASWRFGDPLTIHWHELATPYTRRLPGGYTEEAWRPKRNPTALRYLHLDTSLSGDCTGLCLSHIERWVDVVRRTPGGEQYADRAPHIVVDFMLQIRPPLGEQIQLADVRALIYEIMDHGFSLIGFSTDSYQSADTLQQMKRRGVAAEILSVDVTMAPYEALRSAIYERRIELYPYEPLLFELRALEHDRVRGKVDHPVAGCFIGSTRVQLASGEGCRIDILAGRQAAVASWQAGQPEHTCAEGRYTKHTRDFVRVHGRRADTGAHWVETCTPEHRWLVDGAQEETWVAAAQLCPGERLAGAPGGVVVAVEPWVCPVELPVYDLEAPDTACFQLASGCIVHNSKDCSDALAGCVAGLLKKVQRTPIGVVASGEGEAEDDAWVRAGTAAAPTAPRAAPPPLPFLVD
jgi:hypothetical protein